MTYESTLVSVYKSYLKLLEVHEIVLPKTKPFRIHVWSDGHFDLFAQIF
jgi:hypothetical protein